MLIKWKDMMSKNYHLKCKVKNQNSIISLLILFFPAMIV